MGMMLQIYKSLLEAGTPVLEAYLSLRLRRGKEDPERTGERRGQASQPRPKGRLVWCHAASVGESVSLLPVVQQLVFDGFSVLVTTGTVTSAKVMAARLPQGAFHQYIPVDHPVWVARFLDHWQPDVVLWAESEFWPNILAGIKSRQIPTVLLNARMSPVTFKKWRWAPKTAATLLSVFDLCLAQNADEAARLSALGARNVQVSVNLKYATEDLPFDVQGLQVFQQAIDGRPCLLWASTHAGDEAIALRLHRAAMQKRPDMLTVIVPRHPVRGDDVAQLIVESGLSFARRSKGALPDKGHAVYLADTLGELGLFFRAIPTVIMGGSFSAVGGHNPIEPAQLGCRIFFGPKDHNFKTIVSEFLAARAMVQVQDENDLLTQLAGLKPDVASDLGVRAKSFAQERKAAAQSIFLALKPYLARECHAS
jgi:3-deoxy-D-manno-octulosonic-acid transferase